MRNKDIFLDCCCGGSDRVSRYGRCGFRRRKDSGRAKLSSIFDLISRSVYMYTSCAGKLLVPGEIYQ